VAILGGKVALVLGAAAKNNHQHLPLAVEERNEPDSRRNVSAKGELRCLMTERASRTSDDQGGI